MIASDRVVSLTTEDIRVLQAVADQGDVRNAALSIATDSTSIQAVLERLQDQIHTRSLVDTIVRAYRAGLIH